MTMVSAVVPVDGFEAAVRAARKAGRVVAADGLGAPLDGSLWGRINAVWDRVEAALREAYVYGRECAVELTDLAVMEAQNLLEKAGDRVREVHHALLGRLLEYANTLVDRAVATVREELTVGGTTLRLSGVDVSHKVSLSGSLKTTINDLVALTGMGEVTVMARYGSVT